MQNYKHTYIYMCVCVCVCICLFCLQSVYMSVTYFYSSWIHCSYCLVIGSPKMYRMLVLVVNIVKRASTLYVGGELILSASLRHLAFLLMGHCRLLWRRGKSIHRVNKSIVNLPFAFFFFFGEVNVDGTWKSPSA